MMLYTANRKLSVYNVTIKNLEDKLQFTTEIKAVDKDVLLNVLNLAYRTMLTKYLHLTGIKMNENQTKATLPIHVILGANDFTKIKTQERSPDKTDRRPSSRINKYVMFIMSPGKKCSYSNVLLTAAAIKIYEELCRLMYRDCQTQSSKQT